MNLFTNTWYIKLILLLVIICFCKAFPQSFTKITDGGFVNDGGESFGVSWADFNNDGYQDLFISNGGSTPVDSVNFIYINNGDGTYSKVTTGEIVTLAEKSNGSTIADYNNDGFADVFITNRDDENNSLFLNNGDLTFTKITSGDIVNNGGNSNGSAWADYNNDGLLDLFVSNFFEASFLYENQDGNIFNAITSGHPVSEVNTSISCSWGDYNNDGYVDLFVPNAESPGKANLLYTNNGDGSFTKVLTGEIVTDIRASMGGSWGDYDNDGDLDLFVANQVNSVNDLYINNNNGTFSRLDSGEVVSEASNSISGSWVDYDNDGDLDLFVTNWQNGKNFLYKNSGYPDYVLSKVTTGAIVNDEENTMGGAWADFDNDGDLDLFIANRGNQNNSFYRNDNPVNNWIIISFVGINSNKSAIGTRVKIKASINGNSTWQMREINSQSGYNSQGDPRVHFGLGGSQIIDSLIIEWSPLSVEINTNVTANNFYKAVEGNGISIITSVIEDKQNIPTGLQLFQNYPNPFNPVTNIQYAVNSPANGIGEQFVSIKVYDVLGKEVATLVNENKPVGNYEVRFNAGDFPSGIYFYQLKSGNILESKKMILLK